MNAVAGPPRRLVGAAIVVALVVGVGVLIATFLHSLLEMHGFRQAQTAVSAAWMLRGAPWLDYWTPVLGPPWSIPFEFPLYQWLIAGIAWTTGCSVNAAGALLSYCWLLASVPPVLALARRYALPAWTGRCYALLLLASPLYLFWGRAVMIETQAMSLSVIFVWALDAAAARRAAWPTLVAVLAGTGAALTKITTFMPFLLAGGAIVLWRLRTDAGWGERAKTAALGSAMALPGLAAFAVWNAHADALKSLNPLAAGLRSDAPQMVAWNFGTAAQRLSGAMVDANLRALVDCFGLAGPVLLVVLGWQLGKVARPRGTMPAIAVLVALYVLPWLVLTNLHIVHNYYQTANGLFAIAATAVALGVLAAGGRERLAAGLCIAFALSDWGTFALRTALLRNDPIALREAVLARVVAARTAPDSVLLIYGLDWSPVVPFTAGRLARMEPPWTTATSFRERLPALDPAPLDGHPIGAVIRCPSQVEEDPYSVAQFKRVERHWRTIAVADCHVSFAPVAAPIGTG